MRNDCPHAPIHRADTAGVYMVTSATLYKQHWFKSPDKLSLLESSLFTLARKHDWQLEAWAVFSNHYHFITRTEGENGNVHLKEMVHELHSDTARELNRMDGVTGRKIWYNFWDTKLTYPKSYFARLNYVHQNPVKHGLVKVANQYRWCSAAWFEKNSSPPIIKSIYTFKIDKLNIIDDF